MKRSTIGFLAAFILMCSSQAHAQVFTSQRNIVYGNSSGSSLLMDIHQPVESNGRGIIYIIGSAFGFVYPASYNQTSIKDEFFTDSVYMGSWGKSLLRMDTRFLSSITATHLHTNTKILLLIVVGPFGLYASMRKNIKSIRPILVPWVIRPALTWPACWVA